MNRAEAVRRLREYLPQYVEHSQRIHWIGPLPIANRALVLYGSTLSEADEIGDIDLENIVWSPYPGWLIAMYNAFGTPAIKGISDEYGFHVLERGFFEKSHPTSSLVAMQVDREWPPERIYRIEEGKKTAGAVGPWIVLWEPEMPNWEGVVERIERGEIPPTPERSWHQIASPGSEKQELVDWVFDVLECEAGNGATEFWYRLLVDIVLGWRHAPPFVRQMLPWEDLHRGMERGLYEAIEDDDWAFILVSDMEEVIKSDEGYLRGES
jgi:hypothetical protein